MLLYWKWWHFTGRFGAASLFQVCDWLNVCTGKWPTTTWPHKLTILWNSTLYWHCTTFYHTLRSKNVWSRIWIIVHLRFFGTLRCTDITLRSTIHNEAKKYMKSNWNKTHSLPAKILPYLFQSMNIASFNNLKPTQFPGLCYGFTSIWQHFWR